MQSRREFLQLASITAMLIGGKSWSAVAAKQEISENDLLKFDSKGQITLLHITDIHGQLKPFFLGHHQKILELENTKAFLLILLEKFF